MPLKNRCEVAEIDRWDLSGLYKDDASWEVDFESLESRCGPLLKHKGVLGDSAANLSDCLTLQDNLSRSLGKLFTYASRRADEDTGNTHCMAMLERVRKQATLISAQLSWIKPEILDIEPETLKEFLKEPVMNDHQRTMEIILRDKPYSLTEREERLLALAGEPLDASAKTFGLLNNADLKFPKVKDADDNDAELTHGNYILFLESENRQVRRNAFEGVFSTYSTLKNTLSSTLSGSVNKHVFYARARGYKSAIHASLHRDNVELSVYDNLISSVHQALPTFHKYVALRKKQLNLTELDMYDMYVPIVPDISLPVSFDQAFEWVCEAVKPLGDDYQNALRKALDERWIDRYENQGKRSGAYSGGCYDSNPFILMNFQESINSAFTLAHELGHSMHSYLSNASQPYNKAQYKIFVAEVASTLNECLLFEYLMETQDDPKVKAFLLNQKCEGFKGTVFRQTMFAEFEKMIYGMAEGGTPLTPDALCQTYSDLNTLYYGQDVKADPLITMEWARIPHFYYNFYVYKYATGFCSAEAFAARFRELGTEAREMYLGFLKAGGSKDPLDILSDAGVDLRTPRVIESGLRNFDRYIDQLTQLLG